VDALACAPEAVLQGTYKNKQQKLVDQMLSHDAGFYARGSEHRDILIVSDDEDFMPAVLSLTIETDANFLWLRQRADGDNDRFFDSARVELLVDPAWQ
jgi:hypothetical protein